MKLKGCPWNSSTLLDKNNKKKREKKE